MMVWAEALDRFQRLAGACHLLGQDAVLAQYRRIQPGKRTHVFDQQHAQRVAAVLRLRHGQRVQQLAHAQRPVQVALTAVAYGLQPGLEIAARAGVQQRAR